MEMLQLRYRLSSYFVTIIIEYLHVVGSHMGEVTAQATDNKNHRDLCSLESRFYSHQWSKLYSSENQIILLINTMLCTLQSNGMLTIAFSSVVEVNAGSNLTVVFS